MVVECLGEPIAIVVHPERGLVHVHLIKYYVKMTILYTGIPRFLEL